MFGSNVIIDLEQEQVVGRLFKLTQLLHLAFHHLDELFTLDCFVPQTTLPFLDELIYTLHSPGFSLFTLGHDKFL